MSTQMQLRGGTTAETLLFTGAQREATVDTDKNTLVVHDGVTPGGFPLATEDDVSDGTFYYSDDTGGGSAADAYILVPKPNTNVPNAYLDGVLFGFTTNNANTGPSTANFQGLGVKNIKLAGGSDPAPGDIAGRVTLIYDAANDWLELQIKPTAPPPQLRTIGASVNLNAMTVTLDPCIVDFRSPTLATGVVQRRVVTSQISLTIPAGATLGTISAALGQLAIVAIDNAGTVELAVINLSGSPALTETGVISTTAISAGSSSASVFYSTSARANVPYRVVGIVESTQAAAGTWATAPSKVQGQGGQAQFGNSSWLVSGSAQSTTAGTAIDFTGLPAGVKRLTVVLNAVSTNAANSLLIQIGSGAIENTGYSSTGNRSDAGTGISTSTSGFVVRQTGAAQEASVVLEIVNVSGLTWVSGHCGGSVNASVHGGGNKVLAGVLDRVRLTTTTGTDTFDGGSVNIIYEG